MEIAVEGPLVFDSGAMVVEAALAGIGLGYYIEPMELHLV
jgi:hypothetical protein